MQKSAPEIPKKHVLKKEPVEEKEKPQIPKMAERVKPIKKPTPEVKKKPMKREEFGEDHLEDLKKNLTDVLDSSFLS